MINRKALAFSAIGTLATVQVATAQDLSFVEDTTQSALDVFDVISVIVITLAIIWAGFGLLFTRMPGETAVRILFGGALIGAAPQVAEFLYNLGR